MSHKQSGATAPLHSDYQKTQLRPMIAAYDPKKQGVKSELSELVMVTYNNETPVTLANGSTVPLVEKIQKQDDEELGDYNPFDHRNLKHPTSDMDTFVHLLKGSLGSGILAMPLAFKNSGLWFGLVATVLIGVICTYCVHILVKCAHKLCHRTRTPALSFSEIAEVAFKAGPQAVHKYTRLARFCINMFLVLDLIGCCCVYIVFVSTNIKQVVDYYSESEMNVRLYMLMLLPLLIPVNLIRNLKYLAPFSMIANLLMATGVGITFYYVFTDVPSLSSRPAFAEFHTMPMFFGTVIFALEGIGVVMSLENNMKTPTHFIGCPGVLNSGMSFVVVLYAAVGFFGYLKYGDTTEGSVTLNLPKDELLAQSVKVMIALAIFFTYSLQFYVPMEIIWKNVKHRFEGKEMAAEYTIRVLLVLATVGIAIAIPNLGPFISLIGAVCLSFLGLIFPSIIETVTYWERPGLGRFNWIMWKNFALILFGLIGFLTGTYVSIQEILADM